MILALPFALLVHPFFLSGEKTGFVVELKTKEVLRVEEVALEKNMLVFVDTDGDVIAVSKRLVDWYKAYFSFPSLYDLYCPEPSRKMVQARLKSDNETAKAAKAEKKRIILTTRDLKKMEPFKYTNLFSDIALPTTKKAASSKAKTKKKDKRKIIKVIARGDEVRLEKHLEPGRYVIFDFYADWCGPCRRMTPQLEKLVSSFPAHIALKKIDIQSWGTPVAIQHGIRSIPHVVLYDSKGKRVGGVGSRNVQSYLKGKANSEKW